MATRQRPRRKGRGTGDHHPPTNRSFDEVVTRLGPSLGTELEQLRQVEGRIIEGLSDPRTAKEFLADPARALAAMGLEVPPIIGKRLKSDPAIANAVGPRSFRLPNGQVVTARVNVRITNGRMADCARD
jgi:hypothetical protein